jgi:hypothetical protein
MVKLSVVLLATGGGMQGALQEELSTGNGVHQQENTRGTVETGSKKTNYVDIALRFCIFVFPIVLIAYLL